MRQLKHAIELRSQVKVYVPSTINVEEAANTDDWTDKALVLMAQSFGGSTCTEALGAWVTAGGKLVKERIIIVFSFCSDESLQKGIEDIYSFCLDMKAELKQESIALEVNGKLYLI